MTYELDTLGRRVGRSAGGVKRRYAYGASIHPVEELDVAGNVLAQFVYVTRKHVPDLMIRGTKVYRLITDHLGSVRLVVDVDAGTVAQRIDYDAWGRVTGDTSPGFQPFGFAASPERSSFVHCWHSTRSMAPFRRTRQTLRRAVPWCRR